MKLELKDINKVLRAYDMHALSKKKIPKGLANVNYKIETKKGNFIFRMCKEKSFEDIKYEISVLSKLKEIDFPAAYPIQRKDKTYISKTAFGEVVVYEFIEGNEPEINKDTVKEIARALAKLHSVKGWRKLKKENALSLELCKKVIKKFECRNSNYPKIFEYFKEETEYLTPFLKIRLPKGFVHGDIFADNTKFTEGKLIAILDFEEVCTDNLLFDVGMSINGFCFKYNRLDKELLDIFLAEYEKKRNLTDEEKELLPYYIQWSAHSMIGWHLNHILNEKDKKKLKRVKELIDRVKNLGTSQTL